MRIRFLKDWNTDRAVVKHHKGEVYDAKPSNVPFFINNGIAEVVHEPKPARAVEPEAAVAEPADDERTEAAVNPAPGRRRGRPPKRT